MENIKINLKVITTDINLIQSKIYIIQKFCNIYNLEFSEYPLQKKINKVSLLRSPHIHKKTWRTYKEVFFIYNFQFIINNKKNLIQLQTLLQNISSHCSFKLKYFKMRR